MKNKKAEAIGESIVMMYRIFLLTIVVLLIMGISNGIYMPNTNVKDSEAIILSKKITNCILDSEEFNIKEIKENFNSNILEYCNFKYNSEEELYNKYFIRIKLNEETLMFGDDGKSWVNEIMKTNPNALGDFKQGYSSIQNKILLNGEEKQLNLEVYINE
ncbi:MAG: hypothetical protein PHX15_02860 [Candidatus Nanoarchaeia archaeon]|jgi:hypothetical protein|nr:hypothetical protein [Candidatus Nanoarchaeia archaeon]MDD3994109.1 hypothetical protein [Candidatus Nanoarchaeia archaeon]MDD4563780.1 hypothetical protein [Candidatus Nanoarchaeia archaeon]